MNIVDKGDLPSIGCTNTSWLACTQTRWVNSYWYVEADTRFSNTKCFTNQNAAGCYDYQGVQAHEAGHALGLAHANSSPYLTMYYQAPAGSDRARTLARGDVLGLRAIYP